jgi:hypothetical protein
MVHEKGRARLDYATVKATAKVVWKPVTHLVFTPRHKHNDRGEGGACRVGTRRVGAAVFIWPFGMEYGGFIFMVALENGTVVGNIVADKYGPDLFKPISNSSKS